MLSKELAYENIQVYHMDSSEVLGYIHNDARRFHTYVGNRVQHIRDRLKPDQWHYVSIAAKIEEKKPPAGRPL